MQFKLQTVRSENLHRTQLNYIAVDHLYLAQQNTNLARLKNHHVIRQL